jgi:hypothetical protein
MLLQELSEKVTKAKQRNSDQFVFENLSPEITSGQALLRKLSVRGTVCERISFKNAIFCSKIFKDLIVAL